MDRGLIHIYCGDGKGKTTAAVGLAVRAAGRGRKVVFTQFFKDGSSAECAVLKSLPTVTYVRPEKCFGFFWTLSDREKEEAAACYGAHLARVEELAAEADLLVLDEAMSACAHHVVCEAELLRFLARKPANLEVVLTGRNPSPAMVDAADYLTEMRKVKHPFDRGVPAREGVEY